MIDLHTHTFMSDGVLSISELVYREKVAGYEAIAITDHTDFSNYKQVIDAVKSLKDSLSYEYGIKVLSGVELTYVPPKKIYDLTKRCRDYGADIVVVHGETSVETVPEKTNIEAIKAKVDILAHPGFISDEEVILAKDNGVFLEITTRPGHRNTNKLVFEKAKKFGAKLVCNNDAHYPENILNKEKILQVLSEFEIFEEDYYNMLNNSKLIIKDK
jgi:putative hydrolase